MTAFGAVSFPAAFVAGLLSFLSPCILPIIPGYLSFISGRTLEELGSGQERRTVLMRTLFFVAGFSLVFSLLGLIFAGGSMFLTGQASRIISIAAGSIIMVFGFNILFNFIGFLNIELRSHAQSKPVNAADAFVVGMAFGAGWTPCIGPMLASILLLAAQAGSAAQALLLLLTYSLGLGLPFVLAGLFFPRLGGILRWMRDYRRPIKIASGLLLIGLGALMVLGRLTALNSSALRLGYALQTALAANPTGVKLATTLIWLGLLAVSVSIPLFRKRRLFTPGRSLWLILLAVALILEVTGLVSAARVVVGWLTFQGG